MTTVVDPLGTPTPIYNRSGTTIVAVNANGSDGTTATVVPVESGVTLVLCTLSSGNSDVMVPPDMEIGTVIEAYNVSDTSSSQSLHFYCASGELINGYLAYKGISGQSGCRFTKTDASTWRSVGIV